MTQKIDVQCILRELISKRMIADWYFDLGYSSLVLCGSKAAEVLYPKTPFVIV